MHGDSTASGHLRTVSQKRADVWEVKIRPPHGKQFTKVLGKVWNGRTKAPEGYLTKTQAQGVLRGMLVEADEGRLARTRAVGVTFATACDEYLRYVEHDRKRRVSTVRDYRSSITAILLPHFGPTTALNAITAAHVDGFRESRLEDGRSAATINKQLRILHGIFKRAVKAFGLRSNPVAGVDRQPHQDSGLFDVLNVPQIMAVARAGATAQDRALYITAAFTGLRMGELRALEWSDVDFGKRLIHVRRNYVKGDLALPKSGKVRSVPMTDHVMQVLDVLSRRAFYVDPDCLVFGNEVGGIVSDDVVRRAFKSALSTAGLKPIRFHDLRHTYGTIAVQVFALSDVKAYMGHADIATTMRYVHHVPQHDAADKLSRLIATEAGPGLPPETPPDTPESDEFAEFLDSL
jgi:integrase